MEIEDNSSYDTKAECVAPKIIHTSLMEGIFPLTLETNEMPFLFSQPKKLNLVPRFSWLTVH